MASGAARASSRANSYADERQRNPNPDPNGNFKGEAPDPRASEASYAEPQFPGMAHKRSASGNPRPPNRPMSTEERRYEERRVTERTFEAHVDRILKRTSSPEKQHRRSATGERREGEARRQKSTEFRPRDSPSDASAGTVPDTCDLDAGAREDRQDCANTDISSLEPRGQAVATHNCALGFAGIDSPSRLNRSAGTAAEAVG
jgi:gamma-tubulin complex component 2